MATNIVMKQGVLELHAGPGWVQTPMFFLDAVIEFDVQAKSRDFEGDVVVRGVLGDRDIRGYRFALPAPTAVAREHWMQRPGQDVTILADHPVAVASDESWHHVRIGARATRLTLNVDGQIAGEYEVRERAGVLAFSARHGLGYIKNIQLLAAPLQTTPRLPMPAADVVKAGGRSARLLSEVRPSYTGAAMRAKAQGIVQLEATVQVDGSVTDVHVIKTLHPDLDRNAVTVLRQWKFVPAIVNGSPIPTIERIDLTYTLR